MLEDVVKEFKSAMFIKKLMCDVHAKELGFKMVV